MNSQMLAQALAYAKVRAMKALAAKQAELDALREDVNSLL